MKKALLIGVLILIAISFQVKAQVKPIVKQKNDKNSAVRVIKFKTGKAFTTLPSTKAKTIKGTEIELNTGDLNSTGLRKTEPIKSSQYEDNQLNCTESLSEA
ncbi:MAG: hypothetical protein IPN36_14815 [Bacteroidetes bacterium]|nr:hypothetical protein [Bacteroidota bacterium]